MEQEIIFSYKINCAEIEDILDRSMPLNPHGSNLCCLWCILPSLHWLVLYCGAGFCFAVMWLVPTKALSTYDWVLLDKFCGILISRDLRQDNPSFWAAVNCAWATQVSPLIFQIIRQELDMLVFMVDIEFQHFPSSSLLYNFHTFSQWLLGVMSPRVWSSLSMWQLKSW